MKRLSILTFLCWAGASGLLADFSYQETTKMTGGAMAGMMKVAGVFSRKLREPMVSRVSVKGNRLAHSNRDSTSIIDLDRRSITEINLDKKTYWTMTFEEMARRAEEAAQQASKAISTRKDSASPAAPAATDAQMTMKVSTSETGRTRNISGLDTREYLMKVTTEVASQKDNAKGSLDIQSNVWMAKEVPGYDEVRNFYLRMAKQGGFLQPPAMAQMQESMKGIKVIAEKTAAMDGVPVLTVTSVGGLSADGTTPAGAAGEAPRTTEAPRASDDQNPGGLAGIAGGLSRLGGFGGLGGFGRKKKHDADPQAQQPQQQPQQASAPGALMEMTTEASDFSSAPLDDSRFEVPAGFKQVDPNMGGPGKR